MRGKNGFLFQNGMLCILAVLNIRRYGMNVYTQIIRMILFICVKSVNKLCLQLLMVKTF